MTIRYAYLVLEEHPWGQVMLDHLLTSGLKPGLIIQEVSNVSEVERGKFLARMAGQPTPPSVQDMATRHQIDVKAVPNHNDPSCLKLLTDFIPELTVLGGTRIIKDFILTVAQKGTINAHPGLLPWLRGSASVGWALYKDMKMGATVHFIDPSIDTGAIIEREELPVYRHDTYQSLNYRVAVLAAKLTTRVVKRFWDGEDVVGVPQNPSEGETFRVIPDELLEIGIERLSTGNYSHYSEQDNQ